MKLDHADFASVSAFAAEFKKEHDRLDVFVANAAISAGKHEITHNGFESTSVQIHHLHYSWLTSNNQLESKSIICLQPF
jgi:NAD(P)-dependent dehydrogenase (short-subunit alcohol dehydrogenase family)